MSHEYSITKKVGSKFYNLATVDTKKKRRMTEEEAERKGMREGPLGGKGYITVESAVKAAQERSRKHTHEKKSVKEILSDDE